jgi:hypothetical protein
MLWKSVTNWTACSGHNNERPLIHAYWGREPVHAWTYVSADGQLSYPKPLEIPGYSIPELEESIPRGGRQQLILLVAIIFLSPLPFTSLAIGVLSYKARLAS